MLLTVVTLLALAASAAAGEPFAPVADDATSPAVTDGTRFVVYMRDARTAHVFQPLLYAAPLAYAGLSLQRGAWRFRAPAHLAAGRLSLDVQCASGERGTFVLPIRPS